MGRPFADLIARQLSLIEEENAELIGDCRDTLRSYDQAAQDEALERYERFGDLQEELMEIIEGTRDAYVRTLDEKSAERYEAEFDRAAAKRFRGLWVG